MRPFKSTKRALLLVALAAAGACGSPGQPADSDQSSEGTTQPDRIVDAELIAVQRADGQFCFAANIPSVDFADEGRCYSKPPEEFVSLVSSRPVVGGIGQYYVLFPEVQISSVSQDGVMQRFVQQGRGLFVVSEEFSSDTPVTIRFSIGDDLSGSCEITRVPSLCDAGDLD